MSEVCQSAPTAFSIDELNLLNERRAALRAAGCRAVLSQDHENFPEMIEIECATAGWAVAWMIWRADSFVQVDEPPKQQTRFPTLAAALGAVIEAARLDLIGD